MKAVAMAAALGFAQAYFLLKTEGHAFLQLPSLFPNGAVRIASIAAVMGVALVAATTPRPWLGVLLVGSLIAFGTFEFGYFASRLPPLSDVSLSWSLRPWTRILPIAGLFGFFGASFALGWTDAWEVRGRPKSDPLESRA